MRRALSDRETGFPLGLGISGLAASGEYETDGCDEREELGRADGRQGGGGLGHSSERDKAEDGDDGLGTNLH